MVRKMDLRIALHRQHQQGIGGEAINDPVTEAATEAS